MKRFSLAVRLAIVFAVGTAAVLTGAGLFVYGRVADDLSRTLDQELQARAQDLSALVRRGGTLRTTSGALIERGEAFAELVDRHGRVLDSTPPIGSRALLEPEVLRRARLHAVFVNRSSVPGLDEGARLLAVPTARADTSFVLVVGATRENGAETLRSLRDAFVIGGPLALLLVAAGGYFVARAALRPIEAMRRRAAAISSSSRGERLPVSAATDEVARLGVTLNEMLARLEDGLAREQRFVADASHQLRTPLSLLKTELELALRRPRSVAELEDAIRSAADATDGLARLADDLLVLARAEHGGLPLNVARVDVLDVLDAVAARFFARARVDGRRIEIAAEPVVVTADRLRLEQALVNLVDNGFRYGRGTVTLSAARVDGRVEVHVRDEGAGFPPDFARRAFERFSRADPAASPGSGLGLAIVEAIATAHAGAAGITTRANGRADVWIALPAER